MFKKIGSMMSTALAGLLLVYSAMRSFDFVSMTLPPDKQILAWFALFALDGGLIAWTITYLYGAKGWQRPIAFVMVIVDLLGVIVMMALDTLLNAGSNGMVMTLTSEEVYWAVIGLSGVIGLNIGATVASHLLSPEALRMQAEEEAEDMIETEALKQITESAPTLASEVAPLIASDWVQKKRGKHLSSVGAVQVRGGDSFFGGK